MSNNKNVRVTGSKKSDGPRGVPQVGRRQGTPPKNQGTGKKPKKES